MAINDYATKHATEVHTLLEYSVKITKKRIIRFLFAVTFCLFAHSLCAETKHVGHKSVTEMFSQFPRFL